MDSPAVYSDLLNHPHTFSVKLANPILIDTISPRFPYPVARSQPKIRTVLAIFTPRYGPRSGVQTIDTFRLFIAETGGVYIWDTSKERSVDYLGPSYLSVYSALFLRFVLEYQSSVGQNLSVQIDNDETADAFEWRWYRSFEFWLQLRWREGPLVGLSPGLSPTFSLAPQDVDSMLISTNVTLTDDVRQFINHAKPFDNSILVLRQMVERSLHAKHFFTYNKYSIPHHILCSASDKIPIVLAMYSPVVKMNDTPVYGVLPVDSVTVVYLSPDGNAYEMDALNPESLPRKLGNVCTTVVRNVGFDALPHLMTLCCHHLDTIPIEEEENLEFLNVFPDSIDGQPMWKSQQFLQRIQNMGYSRKETEDHWRREIANFRKSCAEAYEKSSKAFKAGGIVAERDWLSWNENTLQVCDPYEDLHDMTSSWNSFELDALYANRIARDT